MMSDAGATDPKLEEASPEKINIIDCRTLSFGTKVSVVGYVVTKRDRDNRGTTATKLRDFTGDIWVDVDQKWGNLPDHSRVRIVAEIAPNRHGKKILRNVYEIQQLVTLQANLSELDEQMRDQASRMLLSRVSQHLSSGLREEGFVEIDSRVISTTWRNEGLESLQVVYPGFGSPAMLATSPSAQVLNFLSTTGLEKAFTVSTSFTTTYRGPAAGVESRVVVAKALSLSLEQLQDLVWKLCHKVIHRLGLFENWDAFQKEKPKIVELDWGQHGDQVRDGEWVGLHRFPVDIPVKIGGLATTIKFILRANDRRSEPLAEATFETRTSGTSIIGITFHPFQFLTYIEATPPARQLKNLGIAR